MAELKTQKTRASVASFLKSVSDEGRRRDCKTVIELLKKVTGEKPAMWGTSIVGFGSYQYQYPSGHKGEAPLVGVSPRKQELVVYLVPGFALQERLLAKLGKHRAGKGCLYLKRLEGVDLAVLEELVAQSVKATRAI